MPGRHRTQDDSRDRDRNKDKDRTSHRTRSKEEINRDSRKASSSRNDRRKSRSRSKEQRKVRDSSRNRDKDRRRNEDRSKEKPKSSKNEKSLDDDGLNREFDPRDFHEVMYRRPEEGNRSLCKRYEFNPEIHKEKSFPRNRREDRPFQKAEFRQNFRVSRRAYDMYNDRKWGFTAKLLSKRFTEFATVDTKDTKEDVKSTNVLQDPWRPRDTSPVGQNVSMAAGRINNYNRDRQFDRDGQRGNRGIRSRLGPMSVPYRPDEEASKPKLILNDPSMVPRSRTYFDHDERETKRDDRREMRGRGGGRFNGGERRSYRPQRTAADGLWTHDMFTKEELPDLP